MDFTRYRNVLAAAGGLIVAAAAVNAALLLSTGRTPAWLEAEQAQIDWLEIDKADARIAGLAADCRRDPGAAQGPLCVYLGLSTAIEGIDAKVLQSRDGQHLRYVALCGGGFCMEHLEKLGRPLLRSDLKPALVILAVHPSWLVGHPLDDYWARRAAAPGNPLAALQRGDWQRAWRIASNWDWIRGNRIYINYNMRGVLYEGRSRVFDALRVGADAFRTPDPRPWRPVDTLGFPAHSDAAFLQTQWKSFKRNGWFDPAQYARFQGPQAAALARLVAGFRQRGAEVVVVLMPEQSVLRRRIPPAARQYLDATLRRAYGPAAPVVWDFQAAVQDGDFSDYCHLNAAGREAFSRLLAEKIRRECRAPNAAGKPAG